MSVPRIRVHPWLTQRVPQIFAPFAFFAVKFFSAAFQFSVFPFSLLPSSISRFVLRGLRSANVNIDAF